ncbi:MAG: hypothetical protein DRG83_03535 [Deltaproteobacteria bacterium]|nr:MAG: hypothetical protein DRG83_03535 [Deltaproteobacteria bacterium]
MKPSRREDERYKSGVRCKIDVEEKILFGLLEQYTSPGSRVLDVGCGTGEISAEIQGRGYEVIGIDFSKVAVEIATKKGLTCQVVDVDEGLPFNDNEFDAVWATDVIEHVFDPIFVLKEVNRVLVPNGILLATIPYDLHLSNRIRILIGKSYQENVYKKYRQYKHHTFFSYGLLKYMLKEGSFDIREMLLKCRIPKMNKVFITKNRAFLLFGETICLVAQARKKSAVSIER